jgi:hypothetical protein
MKHNNTQTQQYTSGQFAAAAQHVQRDSQALIPENTIIAYKAKAAEFIVFCNTIYSNQDYPQTVTEEKVFGFLFYQAYRGKRRKGRARRGHARPVFDMSDYESVMAKYNVDAEDNDASLWDTEMDVVGYDVINQCLCACLDLLRHQRSLNANNLFIHDIRSERVEQMMNVVARQKKRVAALQFDEKIDQAVLPYMNVQHINQIEDFLFSKTCFKPTYHVASLRDRFVEILNSPPQKTAKLATTESQFTSTERAAKKVRFSFPLTNAAPPKTPTTRKRSCLLPLTRQGRSAHRPRLERSKSILRPSKYTRQ